MHRSDRLDRLRKTLRSVDAFLVMDLPSVHYLSGFTGSSGFVLITPKRVFFITDFRYKEQAVKEVGASVRDEQKKKVGTSVTSPYEIIIEKRGIVSAVKKLVKRLNIKQLGIESSVSYELFSRLVRQVTGVRALSDVVQRLRKVKDAEEIKSIGEAVRRAEKAFLAIRRHIRAGVSERAIALRLEEKLKRLGCRRIPFDIIVASGPNSAMPHAGVTNRRLGSGDLVTIDWGGEADGYFSDMTRTLLIKGRDLGQKKKIYSLVRRANSMARAEVVPGKSTREIDNAARDVIKKAGYGDCFGHGLGHGVGLEVHEQPRISWTVNETIAEGMVFTIEPGIYVPDLGGVRIEDMVAVGKNRARLLTSLPRKLEII